MNNLKVQSVPKKDYDNVTSFALKTWTKYNEENNYFYKEKEFRWAAYIKGKIVGYIYGNTNGGVAYLDDIIVDIKFRNIGIGKILLKKFEEIAKKNHCHVCLLATTDKHAKAIAFYKRNGYVIEAKLANMYWNVNEYYMVKRLGK